MSFFPRRIVVWLGMWTRSPWSRLKITIYIGIGNEKTVCFVFELVLWCFRMMKRKRNAVGTDLNCNILEKDGNTGG